jgi:hypothetical protein
MNCDWCQSVKPFHAQYSITSPHGNREHVDFQMIIPHLEFEILTTVPTLHRTPITDEDLKIRNMLDKTMDLLNKPTMNKIMGATTINQYHK